MMTYDSITCQLNKVLKNRHIKYYISISPINLQNKQARRLNPQLNLEGENVVMIQVTIKVAIKVPTCPKCGEKTILEDYIVWTQTKILREQNFGRCDLFKLCVLPMFTTLTCYCVGSYMPGWFSTLG